MYQYASRKPESADDYVRRVAGRAPAHIRAAIDRQRERHGANPLWSVHRRSRPATTVVLVGACSPGVSSPVYCAHDGLRLVEMVSPSACEHSLRMVKARAANVELREGHKGDVVTDTKSGGLEFLAAPGTGLMMVARVPLTSGNKRMLAHALAGRLRLSIGFVPRRTEIVKRNGRSVRCLQEIELHHVAALWEKSEHGTPCFPEAKVFAAFEHDERAVRRAMKLAAVAASTAELKKGWN